MTLGFQESSSIIMPFLKGEARGYNSTVTISILKETKILNMLAYMAFIYLISKLQAFRNARKGALLATAPVSKVALECRAHKLHDQVMLLDPCAIPCLLYTSDAADE